MKSSIDRLLSRALVCFFLVLGMASSSLAQTGGSARVPTVQAPATDWSAAVPGAQWYEYRPAGKGFRIELPGTPLEQDETVQTTAGPVINHKAMVGNDDTAFTVMYADFPASMSSQPTSTTLQNVRNGEIGKHTLRQEANLTVNGLPAKRLVIAASDGSFIGHSLIVVKGLRSYQVIYAVRPGREKPADIDRFIRSFAILN